MKRRWILWLLIIAFVWLLVSRFAEVEKLAQTLRSGQWEWVLAAALIQVVYYLALTASYWSAFDTVEVKSRVLHLVPVMLASIFVNVVTPTGGTGGAALFVDDARRSGQSPGRAAAGTLLQLIADFGTFTVVLLFGLVYLSAEHILQAYEVAAAVILFSLVAALSGVMLLGLWRPAALESLLTGLQNLVLRLSRRLKRPPIFAPGWAEHHAAEFKAAAQAIGQHPRRLVRTLAIAAFAHLADLASLYLLFVAFHFQVSIGQLVAGFAMGILFWIVSITPQGIGVVEGVMALVYTSLHVPPSVATTVALAFRGLTFWLPLILGFILMNRVKSFGAGERVLARGWSLRAVALLTGLMGVINVISAVRPALASRLALLENVSPLEVRSGGRLTAALAGFALLMLASNLWRRKRVAWVLALLVLVISAISHLAKGLDYEEASLALALAVWLAVLHRHFHARSDPPSVRQGLNVLAAALLFTLAYGVAGFYLLDRHYSVNFGLWAAIRQTVVMFSEFYDPGLVPLTGFGRYFAGSIYVVGAVTLAYAAVALARPVFVRTPARSTEQARAKEIVQAYGHSSLARLVLLEDKLYFFSPGGSVIAYAVRGRVALALGDPIGPAGDFTACLAAFQALCSQNDWTPAFYQALPEHLDDYHQAGFNSFCIGQEGIVDLSNFSLAGGENKSLRTPYNRINRLGYRAEVIIPSAEVQAAVRKHTDEAPMAVPIEELAALNWPILLEELRQVSDDWLASVHGSEKRFSLGWFHEAYLCSTPLIVIRSPENRVVAFANLIPEYQADEVAIDLMRHCQETENGLMEFLFVSLLNWAKDQGCATFNMGLSALWGVGEHPEDPAAERVLHYIYEHVNQFYNFKGLHNFKEKFHPSWSPRYLVYPGAVALPTVALALAGADAGAEGLLEGLLSEYLARRSLKG